MEPVFQQEQYQIYEPLVEAQESLTLQQKFEGKIATFLLREKEQMSRQNEILELSLAYQVEVEERLILRKFSCHPPVQGAQTDI